MFRPNRIGYRRWNAVGDVLLCLCSDEMFKTKNWEKQQ